MLCMGWREWDEDDWKEHSTLVEQFMGFCERGGTQPNKYYIYPNGRTFESLVKDGFSVSAKALRIREIAANHGYKISDINFNKKNEKEFDPKVVFVTNQHGFSEDGCAGILRDLVKEGILNPNAELLLEGAAGELLYQAARKNPQSLDFFVRNGNLIQPCSVKPTSYLYKSIDSLKEAGIPITCNDDLELAREFGEALLEEGNKEREGYRKILSFDQKMSPEQQAQWGKGVKAAYEQRNKGIARVWQTLSERGERAFLPSICEKANSHFVVQVFGIYDMKTPSLREGLAEKEIAYMSLVPEFKPVSENQGERYLRDQLKKVWMYSGGKNVHH